ncbi:hypothetical protein, partial [Thiolapillus sp.]|uniref:hypothetical protein n=1 Tax=Thiolapillus sp. TaxID=2017437 RepID=UPI003AF9C890
MTTYWCPSRPGHQALRNNFASSLLLRTWLPYDWTPRSEAYFASPLALCARRVSSAASRLLGSTSLRFALHGWQRRRWPIEPSTVYCLIASLIARSCIVVENSDSVLAPLSCMLT